MAALVLNGVTLNPVCREAFLAAQGPSAPNGALWRRDPRGTRYDVAPS
jgi:hypothetical protein